MIVRPVAEESPVVHLRRVDDLAGVEQALRIEQALHLAESVDQPLAEHRLVEFGADDAVAMLAGMGALVFADQLERLFGDRPHLPDFDVLLHVEHRPDVQAADRGMGIPGPRRTVPGEDLVEAGGVVRQMRQFDGAVLDEGDRLPLLLHRHHDVEAGFAQFGDGALLPRIGDGHHAALRLAAALPGEAEIGNRTCQHVETPEILLRILLGELDEEQRLRLAPDELLQGWPEHGDLPRQGDHRVVHQLNRLRPQRHQVLRRVHRLVEGREVTDAHHRIGRLRRELQLDPGGIGERALGTDQKLGEVHRRLLRDQRIDVVAADPAHHLRKAFIDLAGLAPADLQKLRQEAREVRVMASTVGRNWTEGGLLSIRQHRIDGENVVPHHAVADRAAAAGIVTGHAADGRPGRGGDIDRKPETVPLQLAVQIIQHDAGLDDAAPVLHVELDQPVEMTGIVQHQGPVDRLTALRGAAAARQQGNSGLPGDGDGRPDILGGARHGDADREDLIDRGVGRIASPARPVEQDLAGKALFQSAFQT